VEDRLEQPFQVDVMASPTLDSTGEITASGFTPVEQQKGIKESLGGVETDGGFAPATLGFIALRQTDSPRIPLTNCMYTYILVAWKPG
jgi:hypothetical protein